MQVTERKRAIGVDDCLHVDFSHFLEFTHIEGILTKQVAGSFALHMPFLEAGVGFFDGFDLFFAQLLSLGKVFFFQLQEPLVAAPQSMALHDFLDCWLRAVFSFQFQEMLNVPASLLRVLGNEFQNAFFDFRRCGLRVCFMDGRQVSQPFKSMFFESFAVFVELGCRDAPFPTYPADVAEFFGEFERLKALVHDFCFFFHLFLALGF